MGVSKYPSECLTSLNIGNRSVKKQTSQSYLENTLICNEKLTRQKYGKHRILYLVYHVKVINIRNYESYEMRQKGESNESV
jgi:hypothetical protein